ncbi:MAG: DUF5011 domain-containing protein [Clostridia bacterium]|nr:DUF5011 domain-containing protein [Clostridia bacterium]
MYCRKCGNEIKKGEMFCSKCGKKIKVSAQNVEAKTTINIKNKKMMIIMIGTIATLILIVLLAIIVPKLKTNLEEQKYQKELQKDLDTMNITLNQDEIKLPVNKEYSEEIYSNQIDLDILENSSDYSKYEKFVDEYGGGLLNITGNVDINKIGEYEVVFEVISEKQNKKSKKLLVKVEDMKKPEISFDVAKVEIKKGAEINVLEGVTATDNVDSTEALNEKIETEGTVDINTVGTYKIKYRVKDSAGLVTEAEREYSVIEPISIQKEKTYTCRIYAAAYDNGYATATVVFHDNNRINFNDIDGMDKISYAGTYTVDNDIVTANVSYYSMELGIDDNLKIKFRILDNNSVKDMTNGRVYKTS